MSLGAVRIAELFCLKYPEIPQILFDLGHSLCWVKLGAPKMCVPGVFCSTHTGRAALPRKGTPKKKRQSRGLKFQSKPELRLSNSVHLSLLVFSLVFFFLLSLMFISVILH